MVNLVRETLSYTGLFTAGLSEHLNTNMPISDMVLIFPMLKEPIVNNKSQSIFLNG